MLSREDIERLAVTQDGLHVSVYLPTHRAGAAGEEDRIRLKNLLNQAEEELIAQGMESPQAEALLEAARNLLPDSLFWQQQYEGLALFISSQGMEFYRLPLDFEPLVVVAPHFHLRPLLPVLSVDGSFYLLTLNQDQVRLYKGTHYSMRSLELQEIPESLAALLSEEDRERQLQGHISEGTVRGRMRGAELPAMFHGHAVVESNEADDILRYFRRINEGVTELLHGQEVPLILAGVEYLLPLYHEANTYPHLLEEGIPLNPQDLDPAELHRRAWEIVKPRFAARREELLNAYHHMAGTGDERAVTDLERVLPAAYFERVTVLFVDRESRVWGHYDPQSDQVEIHDTCQPGDADLLERAAVHTFLNNGQVYFLEPASFPEAGAPLAAVLRY